MHVGYTRGEILNAHRRHARVETGAFTACQFVNVVCVVLKANPRVAWVASCRFKPWNNDLYLLLMLASNPPDALLLALNNFFIFNHG